MRDKGHMHIGTGASSIMMVFVVLCLTTFGVLSMLTSRADLRLSRKNRDAAEAFYTADADAAACLRDIDVCLTQARAAAKASDAQQEEAYRQQIKQQLSLLSDTKLSVEEDENALMVGVLIPSGDGRTLYIRIRVLPYTEQQRYKVLSWKMMSPDIVTEESANIWTGE